MSQTSDRRGLGTWLSTLERPGLDNMMMTSQSWSEATCPQTGSSSTLSCLFRENSVTIGKLKLDEMEWGQIASDHGWHGWDVILSRPGRSGGDEHGFETIDKRRTINTRQTSGTSARTLACSAGPYRSYWDQAGTKNHINSYFVPDYKEWSENQSSCFELTISLMSFFRGSGPPLRWLQDWFSRPKIERFFRSKFPRRKFSSQLFFLIVELIHGSSIWIFSQPMLLSNIWTALFENAPWKVKPAL